MAKVDNFYKHYVPSVPAAIAAGLIFAILTIAHLAMMVKSTPRRKFTIAFMIGGTCEVIGFFTRAASHYHVDSLALYLVQVLLIVLSPILLAASVYMFLGRLITAADGERYAPIKRKWMSKVFLLGDWLCLQVQSSGVSWLGNAKSVSAIQGARDVVLAGLALQIVFFIFFLSVAGTWQARVRHLALWQRCKESGLPLGRILLSLYLIGIIMVARNTYRLAEYAQGEDGYLNSYEWPMYCFDAILMAAVMAIALFWYTIELQPKDTQQALQLRRTSTLS
ncbi:hypothetical protein A1O7_04038 [Cladophialophora yegresii CBS 114405]|uniref:RTA1 like protein n=1 Tax=Cladophialophora yegresii CBS 114405 TaxID=1182544 RepID=W9W5U4_9EURO|nr:uncharacterized protein A1O7_04038 [Cladophialophora yegresii CBS 114405]EXJ59891.1 hypothetical protein A1O7_04038 [Cladophialophora yegresii CBS 114405]